MNRHSPKERHYTGGRDQGDRRPRDQQRPISRSVSPELESGQGEKRRERRGDKHSEEYDRSNRHRSRRSPRSRSPKRRHRRSRSNSQDADRSQHGRRSTDGDRRERGSRRHGSRENDRRHRDREDRPRRGNRERPRSQERNRSPPHDSHNGASRRDRPSEQSSGPGQERRDQAPDDLAPPVEKEKPNYGRSGKLAAETNRVEGTKIVLKYHEPPEARLPPASNDWRMYEFKGKETVSTTELSKRSCWLIGREEAVVDFPVAHPSCSSQHAVLQFRFVEKKNDYGERTGKVKLYVLDLESSNGTSLNGDRIDERRFIEIRPSDVVRFGDSTREYVFLLA